jgi:hypothetical protein
MGFENYRMHMDIIEKDRENNTKHALLMSFCTNNHEHGTLPIKKFSTLVQNIDRVSSLPETETEILHCN